MILMTILQNNTNGWIKPGLKMSLSFQIDPLNSLSDWLKF